jgi:hypothetical protein
MNRYTSRRRRQSFRHGDALRRDSSVIHVASSMTRRRVAFLLAVALAGCAVVHPELGTRTRAIPAGRPLGPPPPADPFTRLGPVDQP